MYFVDREKIEAKLQYMEKQLFLIDENKTWESLIEIAALERCVHTIIESILDVGNAMIDGFIMRDPGSYDDIVDILNDEKVINDTQAIVLKKVISYRKLLVQNYESVDSSELLSLVKDSFATLGQFPSCIRTYLTEELGPISAFRH